MRVRPEGEFCGYPVFVRRYAVADRQWDILGPANFDELLDDPRVEARFYENQDEYMPYWAEFWPASLLLAERLAQWPAVDGEAAPTVLELGCGLGLLSLLVASRGYRAIASDYDDDALAFVQENARRNGVVTPETRFIDWREHYSDLRPDRIIAAEITYEARHLVPIAAFVKEHLGGDGFALFVDRNRQVADPFPQIATTAGLTVDIEPATTTGPDGRPLAARFFILRHA